MTKEKHRKTVESALKVRREKEEAKKTSRKLYQRGRSLTAPRPIPLPLEVAPSQMWFCTVYGSRTFEWKGWLKVLGFRWGGGGNKEWVFDRLSEEHAIWIEETIVAWAGGKLHVQKRRGLYIEPKVRRKRRWQARLD